MKRTLHIFFLILLISVCAITLLAAYGGVFDPAYLYALPAMISMTFPIWIVVMPVLAIVAFCIRRKLAWIPVITMALCVGPFIDFCPLHFTHEQPDFDPGFTLLSYNVFYCENYLDRTKTVERNPTVRTILDSNADVVCLQETLPINEDKFRGVTAEQIDSLYIRYPYRIFNNGNLGILSKYPADTIAAPDLPGQTASLMIADVNILGEMVRFYNVHLQSIGLTDTDKELYKELTRGNADNHLKQAKESILSKLHAAYKNRANQARLIKEVLQQTTTENMVVCGDFNDIPGCYAMRKIQSAGLKNAYTHAGLGPSPTYRADRFYFHIDQVLYNNGLAPTEMYVIKNTGQSDHLPVLTDFEFR
ncbi:MAG: endonuclease/exonuclease/phosphatase family protein [Muribaculaceae bacterium]|nr:endonuclease/exonuclease/phosphatase family protein [Muribaculaceae bacterium]